MSKKKQSEKDTDKSQDLTEGEKAKGRFQQDQTKKGWILIEHGPVRRITDISKLELRPFFREGENCINGKVIRERAEEMDCALGQEDAEYLVIHQNGIPTELRHNFLVLPQEQNGIPTEFRKYFLVFPGTIWQDPFGYRGIAILYFNTDGRWQMSFLWLDRDWPSSSQSHSYRFLSVRES